MKLSIALLLAAAALSASAAGPTSLDQSWTDEDRQWFYTVPQGSKAILYSWAMALEVPGGSTRWVTTLTQLGFLPSPKSARNPDGLPVGIVRDDKHLGLTCAACHTKQIDYQGTSLQIDGAPTDADFFGFMQSLRDAVAATARSPFTGPKFDRFAKAVLGNRDTNARRQTLYIELQAYDRYFSNFIDTLTPTTTPWGRARGDAFANMYNRVTALELNIPSNAQSGNAPASYPTLWDTTWEDKVEWNGAGGSTFLPERLARNVGETLGVFGQIELKSPRRFPPRIAYRSTVKRANLLEIEQTIGELRSPKWPEKIFGALDAKKVALGEQIYIEQCRTCHAIVTPGVLQQMTMTPLDRVGTDRQLATVAYYRQGDSGILEGTKEYMLFGGTLGPRAQSVSMLTNAVIGAMDAVCDLPGQAIPPRAERVDRQPSGPAPPLPPPSLAYRARPLDGIWATAPYLHNGSVPTLWDLLLPPDRRPKTFYVGNREFDPLRVGEQTTAVPGATLLDTNIDGNRNSGHLWGTTLTDAERWALIEYLKSL